jgi:predicted GNAT superfamily acetyltransferase
MKKQDLELARTWRQHTREIFEYVFSEGYMITDFIHLKEETIPRSYYVLSHGESRLG